MNPEFSMGEAKEAIRQSRVIKKIAKEEGVGVTGKTGQELEDIDEEITDLVERSRIEQAEWIEEQERKIQEHYPELELEELRAEFRWGLRLFFIQQYRVLRETESLYQLSDPDYLKEQIFAYTFDFIQSLKSSKKLQLPKRTALDIAQRSVRNNPDTIIYLRKKFPEVSDWVITIAATKHSDAEEFISGVARKVNELGQQFPTAGSGLLFRAAVSYPTRSEQYLREVFKRTKELAEEFPEADGGVLLMAVQNYKSNPAGFIRDHLQRLEELGEEFPDVNRGIIKFASIHYPTVARKYILDVKKVMADLEKDFPDENRSFLVHAATSYTYSAIPFVTKARAERPRLKQKYPGATDGLINRAVVKWPNSPDAYIEKFLQGAITDSKMDDNSLDIDSIGNNR